MAIQVVYLFTVTMAVLCVLCVLCVGDFIFRNQGPLQKVCSACQATSASRRAHSAAFREGSCHVTKRKAVTMAVTVTMTVTVTVTVTEAVIFCGLGGLFTKDERR
jgi:hypothetical protein